MERMSMQDARYFYLEDDNVLLHIGACAVFEGPVPTLEEFRRLSHSKLPEVRRFRQVAREVPWSLGRPVWTDDVSFRIENHVQTVAADPPGDDAALQEVVAGIMATRLDRSKPLWQSTMVTGLAGDRWAVLIRAHHSMVDGVSGAELLKGILDIDPAAETAEPDDWSPDPAPSDVGLAVDAVGDVARGTFSTLGSVASLFTHPGEVASELGDVDAIRATPEKFMGGQTSALGGPIGPDRHWRWVECDLDALKAIKDRRGCKVNDVVLAAVTGGFRTLLQSRGEDLDGLTLRTVVPLSTHSEADTGTPENHVTSLIVELPVGLEDPDGWIDSVTSQMEQLKAGSGSRVGDLIGEIGDLVYRGPVAVASRSVMPLLEKTTRVSIGTVTTNIPGPQFPLYCLGRRLEGLHPYVPVLHGIPIAVAVLTYDGHLSFGLTADGAVEDLPVLAAGLEEALAALGRSTSVGSDSNA
jgi:diacylglycerol O-acyltransferase